MRMGLASAIPTTTDAATDGRDTPGHDGDEVTEGH
jgi:hypothetical protein